MAFTLGSDERVDERYAMKLFLHSVLCAVAFSLVSVPATAQTALPAPWDSVEQILRAPGTENAGTYRYNLPRSDLHVQIGGVTVAPAIALVGWVGFGIAGSDTVVMGDLVATSAELGPVLRKLFDEGMEVTAVHNHLVGETPEIMYIHYLGHGSAVALARKVHAAIALTATPLPAKRPSTTAVTIDTTLVFREIGAHGRANGALAQFGFNFVPGSVTAHGQALPAPLTYGSPVNIQAVSARRAVATGDFAVPADKVDGITGAMTRHGILVTAVHSHMIGESPSLYFIHFWADGTLPNVVKGLRAAIDAAR